jgi:hypothetical protein
MASVFASVTWFMGCDPDNFFDLVRVEFIEGDPETALAKMKAGRHIIVAEDFARSRNKGVGDRVRVFYGNRDFHFTVAAVVASPALDIAAGYFQANTEMRVVASGSVLGSNEDMARLFNIRGRKLIMLNLDLPPAPVPEEWPPTNPQAARGFSAQYYDEEIPLEQRWHRYREAQKLREIRTALGASQAYSGSVTELKDEIDRELNRVTRILTAIPAVALIVAALGVANLMTANVTARAKQLATIRAVGATKGLILRLVIGEALVLGMLGSALGIGLGLHLAANTSVLADRMWGFSIDIVLPLMFLTIAIGLTLVLCLISGLIPARRAARADVVEALHVN